MSLNTGAKPRAGDPSQREKSPFVVLSTMLQLACLGGTHGRGTSHQPLQKQCTCHQTCSKSSHFRFSSAWEIQPPTISPPKECHRADDSVRCLVSPSVSQMEGGEGQYGLGLESSPRARPWPPRLGDVVPLWVPRRGTTSQLLHHYHVVCNGSNSRRDWDPLSQGFPVGRAREVGAGHQTPSCLSHPQRQQV